MEKRIGPNNNFEKLLTNPPQVYHTSWQEIAFVGTSLNGIKFSLNKNGEKGYWEQVVNNPDGREIKRGQITKGSIMNFHELCLYAPYCPGGEFYSRLRIVTSEDFNGEIK